MVLPNFLKLPLFILSKRAILQKGDWELFFDNGVNKDQGFISKGFQFFMTAFWKQDFLGLDIWTEMVKFHLVRRVLWLCLNLNFLIVYYLNLVVLVYKA